MSSYRFSVEETASELFGDAFYEDDLFRSAPSLEEVRSKVEGLDILPSTYEDVGRTETEFKSDVVQELHPLLTAPSEIRKALESLGFRITGTGGGHRAYSFDLPGTSDEDGNPYFFLITDEDASLPVRWDQPVIMGYYHGPDDHEGQDDAGGTMRELHKKLLDGTAMPAWKKPIPFFDPRDVETINRHRRSIGGDPVDLDAGWTLGEIQEMAERIRSMGRTNNPRYAALKRKLMR